MDTVNYNWQMQGFQIDNSNTLKNIAINTPKTDGSYMISYQGAESFSHTNTFIGNIIIYELYKNLNMTLHTYSRLREAIDKAVSNLDNKGVLLGRDLRNVLDKLIRITTDTDFLKEERSSNLINAGEDKVTFQKEQELLNSILNNYSFCPRAQTYIFNVNERKMLLPLIMETKRIIDLVVSGDEGNFNIGVELLCNSVKISYA